MNTQNDNDSSDDILQEVGTVGTVLGDIYKGWAKDNTHGKSFTHPNKEAILLVMWLAMEIMLMLSKRQRLSLAIKRSKLWIR